MKKTLYYHIFLNDYGTWSHIFMEQFKLLEDVGLLYEFDKVKMTAISKDKAQVDSFINLISTFRNTELTVYMNNPEAENVMSRKMWEDSQDDEDFQMLYLHSKGITSVDNHLKNGNAQTFKNYYYWRHFLNWGVIEKWKDCVAALDTHDLAGVNYFDEPSPHFSGNFWWGNSSYIRMLPDPSTKDWWKYIQNTTTDSWLKNAPDRFRDEMWVCSDKNRKVFSTKNLDTVTNLSASLIHRDAYT